MPILSTSPNWALKQQKQMLPFHLFWIPWKKTPALQASSKILMLRKCQNYFKFQALWQVIVWEKLEIEYFLTWSCRFLHPTLFVLIGILMFQCILFVKTASNKSKKYSVSRIILTFHFSNEFYVLVISNC